MMDPAQEDMQRLAQAELEREEAELRERADRIAELLEQERLAAIAKEKWPRRFLALAEHVAQWSKDPSTKAGAVIVGSGRRVISVGFNGFPQGMRDDPELYADREQKLSRIVHCEMNALLFAGALPRGTTLYTWPFMPCDRCVVHMLQAGIRDFVFPPASAKAQEKWGAAFERTRAYVSEAGGQMWELAPEEPAPRVVQPTGNCKLWCGEHLTWRRECACPKSL